MAVEEKSVLKQLDQAGSILARAQDIKSLISVLVEQSLDITRSDLASLYLFTNPEAKESELVLSYKRGKYDIPKTYDHESEIISFIRESREYIVLTDEKESPFRDLLLHPSMKCGVVLPLATSQMLLGVIFVNSARPLHFNRRSLDFLSSFINIASGMLHNIKLFQDLKEYLSKIEAMERYQDNIFSSMTNLLITTDSDGNIQYFNAMARDRFNLTDADKGSDAKKIFSTSLNKNILKLITSSKKEKQEILGIEGIFHKEEGQDIDFSLNITPLKNKRGRKEGTTLLFTDQSRERELQAHIEKVTEERRVIKDMFSRYLSSEMVQHLVDNPDLVKIGGDKKFATIFFADIRGYTSFSEGKEPDYIINILNEYFSEAVETVIRYKGYIDKFIGDCIMAAWGVPLETEKEDAINAVSCALEIQQLVHSKNRKFFKGEAQNLKVGIGMHSGPLVAGNLGSSRRMDYTVIGDTVNVAARLEGVAGADEVIITQTTRDFLDDNFELEAREPVKVKGKVKPIPIYKVVKRIK